MKEISVKLSLCIGDCLSPRVLGRASVSTAKHVIILPSTDRASMLCQTVEMSTASVGMDRKSPTREKGDGFEHITTVLQDFTGH